MEYFEKLTPQRVRKPRRSESDDAVDDMVAIPTEIPELKVLAQLRSTGEVYYSFLDGFLFNSKI